MSAPSADRLRVLNADLHCHSTVSDGWLEPEAVVLRALANGVELLALTDHDEVGGIDAAARVAQAHGLGFVVAWRSRSRSRARPSMSSGWASITVTRFCSTVWRRCAVVAMRVPCR